MNSGVFGHKLVITSQNWNELFRELYRAVHRWRWCLVALDFARLQQRPLKLASGLFSRFWVYLDTKWTTEIAVKRPFQAKLRSSYSFIFHLQNVEIKFGLLAVTKVA